MRLGVTLSYTFVKQALQAAKLVPKRRPRGRHRRRREPRPCFGEMLHLDGSPHAWLTLCPTERQTLVHVIDDATKRGLSAQLVPAAGRPPPPLCSPPPRRSPPHLLPRGGADRRPGQYRLPRGSAPADRQAARPAHLRRAALPRPPPPP